MTETTKVDMPVELHLAPSPRTLAAVTVTLCAVRAGIELAFGDGLAVRWSAWLALVAGLVALVRRCPIAARVASIALTLAALILCVRSGAEFLATAAAVAGGA